MSAASNLDLNTLLVGLVGGLSLFLYGLEKLTASLKILAGDRMRDLLARMTNNRFKAVFAGAFITSVIQSSSVTTVLVVGFISAGLMTMSQSIGVIMGASIGTTITAQVVAFKVTKYSLLLVATGFFIFWTSKRQRPKQYGQLLLGLGLVFFGMQIMKDAMSPLNDYEPFAGTMKTLDSAALSVLFSALFTALVQSSSATTGVIIALASEGLLELDAAIPLVFGANVGTCITAMLAALGKPREAVRAALVHVLFNVAGVLIWIGFVPELAELVRWMSPTTEGLSGVALLQAETPRQIANAHTVFNVANTAIFIGMTPWIGRLVEWLIPDRAGESSRGRRRQLMDELIDTPALALDAVRRELSGLGTSARTMVSAASLPVLTGTEEQLDSLHDMDEDIDARHADIVGYLGRLSRENLTLPQSNRLACYMAAANYFENIGDMIETNLVEAGRQRLAVGLNVSRITREVFHELHEKVRWTVARASEAITTGDLEAANDVIEAKSVIGHLADGLDSHLTRRLTADEPHRLDTFRLETEMVEALRRIYYFAKRIAKAAIDAEQNGDAVVEDKPDTRAAEE